MTDSLYVKTAGGILPIAIEGTGGGGGSTTIEAETHTITETATSAQSLERTTSSTGNVTHAAPQAPKNSIRTPRRGAEP